MKRGWKWLTAIGTLTLLTSTRPARADSESKGELCPNSERARVPPECSAVHLLSNPGYRVLPRTRIHLGVARSRVAVVVRLAIF